MKVVSGSKLVVVLAGSVVIGCERASIPTAVDEPSAPSYSQVQSQGDTWYDWVGNKLNFTADGNNYRLVRDGTPAHSAYVYKNGVLTHNISLERNQNGKVTTMTVIDVMTFEWFQMSADGETLIAWQLAGSDCDDPDCVDPMGVGGPVGPITIMGDCSTHRQMFRGSMLAIAGGGGVALAGTLTSALFPPAGAAISGVGGK